MSLADVVRDTTNRAPRTIAVHAVCWLLVAVALWDGAGLAFGGEAVTSSRSYDALELVPGGMRAWGVLLLAGAVAVAWGIGQDTRGASRALNVCLSIGVGYYVLWAAVIPATWWYIGEVPAWGGPSKSALLAALYYLCGRAVAPAQEGAAPARG